MAINLSQNLRLTQSQQLVLTPQLQQAIKLLQLNQLELAAMVSQEMEINPVLEEEMEMPSEVEEETDNNPEKTSPETAEASSVDAHEQQQESREALREMDWSQYCDNRGVTGSSRSGYNNDDMPAWDYNLSKSATLAGHLLWQLQMTPSLSKLDKHIGEIIIYNINDDGYLDTVVEDIAMESAVSVPEVETILNKIQQFDPVGIASRNLKECILIQMNYLGINNELNTAIINEHLNLLQNKNYKKIARLLKVNEELVLEAMRSILTIDPKPGRQYGQNTTQAITPDVYVFKHDGDWIIVLNEERTPRLSVSRYYRDLADQQKGFNSMTRNYLIEKIRAAQWLMKSIEQRQKTIKKVMKSILHFQHNFFNHGVHHLHPLILRDVADDIGMHESTVSRVTQNKYAQTPHGIFELKYFFNSSISRGDNDIASESVKQKIIEIIANESPSKPVSDKTIVKVLQEEHDITIARRTIAKYRDMLGILSSSRRKKLI
ncbi:MAG: RNA polymerase factor sigma-54 [Deltaproteobacteria bacterium]|nr:RNA polymerase factor sigma-54 [Deltaproteobacteria bacterium]